MKLRNKILLAIGLAWIVFLALTYAGSRYILLRSFLALEQERALADLGRATQALDQINHSLYTFTSDWAHWNDYYDYMLGKNPGFIPNNINVTAFMNSTINHLTYWNKDGKLLMGTAVDTDTGKYVAYPAGLEKYIYPGSAILDRHDVNKDITGFMLLPSGIMMVAAVAATDGDKLQPPMGAMVTGRYLSQKIVKKNRRHYQTFIRII